MGSVSKIIAPASLRPFLIDAVERGIDGVLDELSANKVSDNGHAGLAQSTAS